MSVSPQASLYAATLLQHPSDPLALPANWVLAAQRVAQEDGGVVGATNISVAQLGPALDGASLVTLGLDWSARRHDLLYAPARGNGPDVGVPVDLYNGIVVGATKLNGVLYDQVWDDTAEENAVDGRRLTNILAPGAPVISTEYDNPPSTVVFSTGSGTSRAAPHITGTVALLQEFAADQGWTGAARQHEVMKAVLMNSADKLMDSGDGKRLCMEKDILNKAGDGWLLSDAFGPATTHPVDDEMGAGQLNAKRALKQFESGQHSPGTVPLIGWDYGATAAARDIKKYKLEKPLEQNSFFSAVLAWDREVELVGGDSDGKYDSGETFNVLGLTDMDLYLVPAGSTSDTQAVAKSATTIYGVEHIFFQVPVEGEYELWVQQANAPLGDQPYAVAWWAKAAPGMCPTDLDGNGATDGGDLAIFLSEWGPNCGHPADFDRNGVVNGMDQAILLAEWGPCTGACCLPNGSCVAVNNRGECDAQGGSYLGDHTDCAKCPDCPPGCVAAPPGDPLSGTGGCPVGCMPEILLPGCGSIDWPSLPLSITLNFSGVLRTKDVLSGPVCGLDGVVSGVMIPVTFSMVVTRPNPTWTSFTETDEPIVAIQGGVPYACQPGGGVFSSTMSVKVTQATISCGGWSGDQGTGIPCGDSVAVGPVWKLSVRLFCSLLGKGAVLDVRSFKPLTSSPFGDYTFHSVDTVAGSTSPGICVLPCPGASFLCPAGSQYNSSGVK